MVLPYLCRETTPWMDRQEEEFIKRINEKQNHAFQRLFHELYRSLVYFSYGYVERKDVAEDIVQEAIVRLWENSSSYPSYNSLKTYLYISVRNASMDYCRHKQVEHRYLSQVMANSGNNEEELDLKIMQEELYRSLLQVIEELPPRCQEIFKLHLSGLKNEEIAQQLSLSIETVKTQKKKAMLYLRKRLSGTFFLLLAFHLI